MKTHKIGLFLLVLTLFVSIETANAAFTMNLQYGMRNNSSVVTLQNALRALGFFQGESTGNFFGQTQRAVQAFQQAYGINPTGFVGPLTNGMLSNIIAQSDQNNPDQNNNGNAPANNPNTPAPSQAQQTATNTCRITVFTANGVSYTQSPINISVTDTSTMANATLYYIANGCNRVNLTQSTNGQNFTSPQSTGSATMRVNPFFVSYSEPVGANSSTYTLSGYSRSTDTTPSDSKSIRLVKTSSETTNVNLPTINSITPSQGGMNTGVAIVGTNLQTTRYIEFYNLSGSLVTSVPFVSTQLISSQRVEFTISAEDFVNLSAGSYRVGVLNISGQRSNRVGFTLTSASSPTQRYQVGDQVRVTENGVLVRDVNLNQIGSRSVNDTGRVTGGPITTSNGLTFWQVDFTSGVDGYVAQQYLISASANTSVTLVATPPTIISGQSSRLTWTSVGTTNCDASSIPGGGVSAPTNNSTGILVSPTADREYSITCYDTSSQPIVGRATVRVGTQNNNPIPSVSLTYNGSREVNLTSGSSVNLQWTATNITRCQMFRNGTLFNDNVFNSFNINTASRSGNFQLSNQTQGATYTLTCTGAGGTVSDNVIITVGSQQPTTTARVDLKVKRAGSSDTPSDGPITVPYNSAVTLSWVATGDTSSCALYGNPSTVFSTVFGVNGGTSSTGQGTSPLTQNSQIAIWCVTSQMTSDNRNVYAIDSVNINVESNPNAPTGANPQNATWSISWPFADSDWNWRAGDSRRIQALGRLNTGGDVTEAAGFRADAWLENTNGTAVTQVRSGGDWGNGLWTVDGIFIPVNLPSGTYTAKMRLSGSSGTTPRIASHAVVITNTINGSYTPILSITLPTTNFIKGNTYVINWALSSAQYASGALAGSLIDSSGANRGFLVHIPASLGGTTGSFSWTVPNDLQSGSGYFLQFTGLQGGDGKSATFNVSDATNNTGVPTVTLTANGQTSITVNSGAPVTLVWSASTNATLCNGSPNWATGIGSSGSRTVNPTATTTFTVSCYNGSSGPGTASAVVNVVSSQTNPQLPIISLSANPTTINAGGSSVLTYTVSNASSCTLNGSSVAFTNGDTQTQTVSPTQTTPYALTCTNSSGQTSYPPVTVTVNPGSTTSGIPAVPTGISASTGPCSTGRITVSWGGVTGATRYYLYRNGVLIANTSTNTAYDDNYLAPGSSHSYSVSAGNSYGDSARSGAAGATAPLNCGSTGTGSGDSSGGGGDDWGDLIMNGSRSNLANVNSAFDKLFRFFWEN